MMPLLPDPLLDVARSLVTVPIAHLFARDPHRVARLSIDWEGFLVDLSKERLTPDVLSALAAHARSAGLDRWIASLFDGERVNLSESQPALHPALRDDSSGPLMVDGADVRPDIARSRARVATWAQRLRAGEVLGATGVPIRHLLHLGIGGSDLGPRLVVDALADARGTQPSATFVANVDPRALDRAIATLDPAATALVIASKSFATGETLANARAAIAWIAAGSGGRDPRATQVLAATARPDRARAFGLPEDAILPMHPAVGGRFSLWSSVGVTIAATLGNGAHAALLEGAAAMDRHFRSAPFERNLPVVLALAGVWNASALGHRQRLVVPYADALALFPAYLQQLSLESNGKRVTRDGAPVGGRTAPALWGGVGTDGQHAFFQWLHQGTDTVPVEFVVPATTDSGDRARHAALVANAFAQAQALAFGRDEASIARDLAAELPALAGAALARAIAVRACPGDRPSTMLVVPRLDARALGALLALYEHRNYAEGVLWGINPFDQFGVELGKQLAAPIEAALLGEAALPVSVDPSTRALVDYVRGAASVRGGLPVRSVRER